MGSAKDGWQAPRLPLAKHNGTLCFLGGRAPLCIERQSAIESARYAADPARPHRMPLRPGWPRPSRARCVTAPTAMRARSREQSVGSSNGDGATEPRLEQLKVCASQDALALGSGDGQAAALEHLEHRLGPALRERATLPTTHEFFGLGMHFEGLFCSVTKSGFDESQV